MTTGKQRFLVIDRTLKESVVTRPKASLVYLLGRLTFPRWLYRGPYWWRSLNAWWLSWWGWVFYR